MPDLSALLLEGYRRLSGPARQQWVEAMIAERDTIDTPAERRRFGRGCAFALLTAPANRDEGATLVRSAVAVCGGGRWIRRLWPG